MKNGSGNKLILILFLLLIVGASFLFFFRGEEKPPEISRSIFQGDISFGNFIEFSESALANRDEFVATKKSSGPEYFYVEDHISLRQIINSIKPDPSLNCFLAKYSPFLKQFLVYPSGNTRGTVVFLESDVDSYLIQPFEMFAILCSGEFETRGLKTGKDQPDIINYNPNLFITGWHLKRFNNNDQFKTFVESCPNRISSFWLQNSPGGFEKGNFNDPKLNSNYYLSWVKFKGEKNTCNNLDPIVDTENPSDVDQVVIEKSEDGVMIYWSPATDNVEVTGYQVHYGTEPVDDPGEFYSSYVDVRDRFRYEITNLNEGEKYYFSVIAYDAAGNESVFWSKEVSIITDSKVDPFIEYEQILFDENVLIVQKNQFNYSLFAINADTGSKKLIYTFDSKSDNNFDFDNFNFYYLNKNEELMAYNLLTKKVIKVLEEKNISNFMVKNDHLFYFHGDEYCYDVDPCNLNDLNLLSGFDESISLNIQKDLDHILIDVQRFWDFDSENGILTITNGSGDAGVITTEFYKIDIYNGKVTKTESYHYMSCEILTSEEMEEFCGPDVQFENELFESLFRSVNCDLANVENERLINGISINDVEYRDSVFVECFKP